MRFARAASTGTSVRDCGKTLRRLTRSTIAASGQSSTIRWITSITGWWKSWPRGTPRRSATIPILHRTEIAKRTSPPAPSLRGDASLRSSASLRFGASLLCLFLIAGFTASLGSDATQRSQSRGKPHKKDQATVRSESATPQEVLTPEDEASRKELAQLARALPSGANGAYENLKVYAEKHADDNWGARAALAAGYFDYTKNRSAQAATWVERAIKDEPLRAYKLYGRAQVARVQGKEAAALTDLETVRQDYPDSAITEQVVEALAATALSLRKPQEAVAALGAHPHTAAEPRLLFLRAPAPPAIGALGRAPQGYPTRRYPLFFRDKAPP